MILRLKKTDKEIILHFWIFTYRNSRKKESNLPLF